MEPMSIDRNKNDEYSLAEQLSVSKVIILLNSSSTQLTCIRIYTNITKVQITQTLLAVTDRLIIALKMK